MNKVSRFLVEVLRSKKTTNLTRVRLMEVEAFVIQSLSVLGEDVDVEEE